MNIYIILNLDYLEIGPVVSDNKIKSMKGSRCIFFDLGQALCEMERLKKEAPETDFILFQSFADTIRRGRES